MHVEHQKHSHGDGTVVLTLHFPRDGLVTTKTPFGTTVQLADLKSSGLPGAPCLPHKQLRVAMPSPMWPGEITIISEQWELISGPNTLVKAAQLPLPAAEPNHGHMQQQHCSADCSCRSHSTVTTPDRAPLAAFDMFEPEPVPEYVPPDAKLYTAAAESPPPIIQGIRVDTAGPTHIAVVEVSPVRMTKRGELELCTLVKLAIDTVPKPKPQPLSGERYDLAVSMFKKRYPARSFDPARVVARPEAFISNRTEAKRVQSVALSHVINTGQINVGDLSEYFEQKMPSEYLIITDDVKWDAEKIAPKAGAGGALPGMVAAFEKLAQAKRARGLTARVVTVTNIVAGKYGDARTGSRDLQEVIRRFLKLVREKWGVCWLLLGGNPDIVPVRRVAGGRKGEVDPKTGLDPPAKGTSFWNGSFLKMNLTDTDMRGATIAERTLVRRDTGAIIPYDANGTSNAAKPGWYFTTDNTYAKRTASVTLFVRVEGPPSLLAKAGLRWHWGDNMLPTDFYYASLSSFVPAKSVWNTTPYVYVPVHDWDALDNGLYGQQNDAGDDLDGVVLHVDISVGRASVANAAQADVFVSKTLAYERLHRSAGGVVEREIAAMTGTGDNWPRKMLIASQDVGARLIFMPTAKPGDIPTKGNQEEYSYDASKSRSLLKIKDTWPNRSDTDWQLFARISDRERSEIRYKSSKTATNPAVPGWYYAKSGTDPTPNVLQTITPLGMKSESALPTVWIVVHGSLAQLTPVCFELRKLGADINMLQQEDLRCQIVRELPGIDRFDRYYEDENDLTVSQRKAAPVINLTLANVSAGLSAGPHFVSLSGHGNSSGCCTLDQNSIRSISNGSPGFIAYVVSCSVGNFTDPGSFCNAIMNHPTGGAVAFIGSTRSSPIATGDDYQRAFFHGLTATRHIGTLNDTRLALTENPGHYGTGDRWMIFITTLLGDPELQVMVQGAQPKIGIQWVNKDDLIHIDDSILHIILYPRPHIGPWPPDPGPLTGALVHVRQVQTGREWMGTSDEMGAVTIPREVLKRFGKGEVEITASKEGYPVEVQRVKLEGGGSGRWREVRDTLCCRGMLGGDHFTFSQNNYIWRFGNPGIGNDVSQSCLHQWEQISEAPSICRDTESVKPPLRRIFRRPI